MPPKVHHPPQVRAAAVKAFYWAHGDMAEAVRLFDVFCPEHTVANPYDFIRYWADIFPERASVLDVKAHGPPCRLSDRRVAECVTILLGGFKLAKGKRHYFHSIAQAVSKSKRLKEIMDGAGFKTPKLLLAALKRRVPGLHRRFVRYCFTYSSNNKLERMIYCQLMLWLPEHMMMQLLFRVFWIDAKKLWVVPKGEAVYAPKGADLYVEHPLARGGKGQPVCIHYYIAVNAVLGPVLFMPVTGTTGLAEMGYPTFTVSGVGERQQLFRPRLHHMHARRCTAQTSNEGSAAPAAQPTAAGVPTACHLHGATVASAACAAGTMHLSAYHVPAGLLPTRHTCLL
jgi:hypothetical protein